MSDCRVTKEEAIELLKAYVGNEYYTEKWQETCRMAIDALNGQAEPVVHGEWEHLGGDEWCCTVCENVITTEGSWEKPTQKFCDECGAKMGGANDGLD